jgi:RNA polymerase sigma-70 factor (ECF subfamily)
MLAAVPNLRAFAISLSGNVDPRELCRKRFCAPYPTFVPAWLTTILRNLFRTQYRKRRREGEDADGSHVDSLKSPPEQ